MPRHEPRLAIKPTGAAAGNVDGGWWPRSLDPTAAFPELVSSLHPSVGPVSRISHHLGLWDPAPPHTPGGVARAVLRSAAGADSTATVEDILASNGVPPQKSPNAPTTATRPEAADAIPGQRWETEGATSATADT